MAFYRYYDTLGSDLDLFGVNDITYSYKPRRLPVLSAGGAYSGSSSYYSPVGSTIHTTLGQRRYGSYNSLGYQGSNYASLGSRYRSYGRGYSGYGSVGLSRRYLDLDSYDLASTYPIRSPTYRSSYVPYLDLATTDDFDQYSTSRLSRPASLRTTTGNLYSRRWYPETLDTVDDSADSPDDEAYVDRMRSVLGASPSVGVPPKPSLVYTNVYVGTTANAENIPLLKSMGITHILNCGVLPTSLHFRNVRRVYGESGVIHGYEGLYIDDSEDFDLTPWLRKAFHFIERARSQAGSVLICSPGVSRSGAVAIGYLLQRGVPLLRATRTVKEERRVALCNVGFMRSLVRFARALNMLDSGADLKAVRAYGKRRDDKFNIYRVYLESI